MSYEMPARETQTLSAAGHALAPYRVSSVLTFSAVAMVLEESAGSQWAGLSTHYSHSPDTYSISADSSSQAARMAQTSSMAAASAYGLYEIPPFEQLARINHGARAPATTPTIAHVVPRASFDTFTASLLTVLQILTLTDWQYVFYDAARTSGSIIAFYFYLLLFMGTSCQ